MMAAEQWCEYQKCYNKYGLNLKPSLPEKEEETTKRATNEGVKSRDKLLLIMMVLIFGIMSVSLIVTTAYSTQLKIETSSIAAKSEEIQGDIENLNLAIKRSGNITNIEARAVNELGMVYPELNQIAFINSKLSGTTEFAEVLRQLAFKDER